MFGSNRIKIDKELMAKLERYASLAGYSSVGEFVTHVLEREVAKFDGADSEERSRSGSKARLHLLSLGNAMSSSIEYWAVHSMRSCATARAAARREPGAPGAARRGRGAPGVSCHLESEAHRDRQARIEAGLYEIRLFNDDPGRSASAAGSLAPRPRLRAPVAGTGCWMLVPFTLLLAQLQTFYGYRPLAPESRSCWSWRSRSPRPPPRAERDPAELRVRPVCGSRRRWLVPGRIEQVWRLRAERVGRYDLAVQVDGEAVTKEVRVAEDLTRLSPVRHRRDLGRQILHPAEPPLRGEQVQSIRIGYPARAISIFGWELPWLVVFFVLVTVFAWILKGRFRVAI